MSTHPFPHDPSEALAGIRRGQEPVLATMTVPNLFWWAIAALMVGLGAAVDARRPVVVGAAVVVFVAGVLALTGWVARGLVRVRIRRDLSDPWMVPMILGLDALVVVISLVTAYALRAAGSSHPATWGTLAGGVVLIMAGTALNARWTRVLRRRAGTQPGARETPEAPNSGGGLG